MHKSLWILAVASLASPAAAQNQTWDFEADAPGAPPAGFTNARTGPGRPGRWIVTTEPDAPAGRRVVTQTDTDDSDGRFALAVADAPAARDVHFETRCKAISGEVDQACGVVVRYLDPDNYYVARSNALEGNVRLYHVREGRRRQIGNWSGPVPAGVWQTLAIDARGDRLRVDWNGAKVIEIRDATFPGPGKVGLWTKADSVTAFDGVKLGPPQD